LRVAELEAKLGGTAPAQMGSGYSGGTGGAVG
jgi:hypothetical protein